MCGVVPALNQRSSEIQGIEEERDGDHVIVTDSSRSVTLYKVRFGALDLGPADRYRLVLASCIGLNNGTRVGFMLLLINYSLDLSLMIFHGFDRVKTS